MIFYYSGKVSETLRQGISSFGNPLVWWLGIPAFVYIVYRVFTKKDRIALFIGVGYLAELLYDYFSSSYFEDMYRKYKSKH